MWKEVVVLISVLACATAATWRTKSVVAGPKPDKFKDVEGCYDPDSDTMIPIDRPVGFSEKCIVASCHPHTDGNGSTIKYVACEVPVKEFNDTPYPECCHRNKLVDQLCVDSGNVELCRSP